MKTGHGGEVAAALALDAAFGEPPENLHPTVWMGRAISVCEQTFMELEDPHARLLAGVAMAAAIPALVYLSARTVLNTIPGSIRGAVGVAIVSTALSMRGLSDAAGAVERDLREGDLEQARSSVDALVGRDTQDLLPSEVARAAVESLAENASDGVVAPMLYGFLFGAPGALAYKAINTLDSMVGYRKGRYEEFGWASARLDDLANLVPARTTALLAGVVSGRPIRTLAVAWRYGPLTASPNAGWAEAAFAGALDLSLGGTNVYGGVVRKGAALGDGRPPEPDDIRRAVRLMRRCCVGLAGAAVLLGIFRRG